MTIPVQVGRDPSKTSSNLTPIPHHIVPLGGVDPNVGVVHETMDTEASAEGAGKSEAEGHGIRRGIGEPVEFGVGTSHGGGL